MIQDSSFIQRVWAHFVGMGMPTVMPQAVVEFAPGVVAVRNCNGPFDLFFDPQRWRFSQPEIWTWLEAQRAALYQEGLRILPGTSCVPQPSTFEAMLRVAKGQLKTLQADASVTWRTESVKIPLE